MSVFDIVSNNAFDPSKRFKPSYIQRIFLIISEKLFVNQFGEISDILSAAKYFSNMINYNKKDKKDWKAFLNNNSEKLKKRKVLRGTSDSRLSKVITEYLNKNSERMLKDIVCTLR